MTHPTRRRPAARFLPSLPALLLGLPPLAAAAADPAPPAPRSGALAAEVACAASPGERYALYLPSAFDGRRSLPVAFAFDMRDEAVGLAETLAVGAERFGWIVAAPHGSSNLDSTERNAARMSAVWADVRARFPVDERRTYAIGFSGMARFACRLAQVAPGTLAGVVGIADGFPEDHPPDPAAPFPFFGVVGERDFSFYELVDLEARMRRDGLPARFARWDGSHERPPPEVAALAFAWLELRAMAEGRRAADPTLVAALWQEGEARSEAAEAAGDLLAAERELRALVEDFAALRAVDPAREALARLAADPRLAAQRAAEERRLARDRRYLERVPRLLASAPARPSPDAVAELVSALEVANWQRRRAEDPDPAERQAAERVLYAVYIQTGNYAPRRLSERGELPRAVLMLQVAAVVDPTVPHVPYRLAVAYARLGDEKAAWAALERALELGWDDRAAIASEPAFATLRASPRMRALLDRMTPG